MVRPGMMESSVGILLPTRYLEYKTLIPQHKIESCKDNRHIICKSVQRMGMPELLNEKREPMAGEYALGNC